MAIKATGFRDGTWRVYIIGQTARDFILASDQIKTLHDTPTAARSLLGLTAQTIPSGWALVKGT